MGLGLVEKGKVPRPLTHSYSAGDWSRVPSSATDCTLNRCVPCGRSVYSIPEPQGVNVVESSAHSNETPVPEKANETVALVVSRSGPMSGTTDVIVVSGSASTANG